MATFDRVINSLLVKALERGVSYNTRTIHRDSGRLLNALHFSLRRDSFLFLILGLESHLNSPHRLTSSVLHSVQLLMIIRP